MTPSPPPAIAWFRGGALAGVAYALPAAVVVLQDPAAGVSLAVGVLPAAMVPMPARRADRRTLFAIGSLAGFSLFVGGVLSHLPTIAAAGVLAGIVVLAAVASVAASNGSILLVLCAPLVAAGLSFTDLTIAFQAFVLLAAGAAYAWLVSLAWAQREPSRGLAPVPVARDAMAGYGLRLGIAAAVAYAIATSIGFDHPGWAPAACLLVARPQPDLLRSRGVGRVVAVTVGAVAAGIVLTADPPPAIYALSIVLVLAMAAGTAGSRWYIASAFTTFFVFLMMLIPNAAPLEQKFDERLIETVIGVGLAYLLCSLLPILGLRVRHDPAS